MCFAISSGVVACAIFSSISANRFRASDITCRLPHHWNSNAQANAARPSDTTTTAGQNITGPKRSRNHGAAAAIIAIPSRIPAVDRSIGTHTDTTAHANAGAKAMSDIVRSVLHDVASPVCTPSAKGRGTGTSGTGRQRRARGERDENEHDQHVR